MGFNGEKETRNEGQLNCTNRLEDFEPKPRLQQLQRWALQDKNKLAIQQHNWEIYQKKNKGQFPLNEEKQNKTHLVDVDKAIILEQEENERAIFVFPLCFLIWVFLLAVSTVSCQLPKPWRLTLISNSTLQIKEFSQSPSSYSEIISYALLFEFISLFSFFVFFFF